MTTLKGIFPNTKQAKRKNFIHENISNLRRIEQPSSSKGINDMQKLQQNRKKINNYINNISHTTNKTTLTKMNPNFEEKCQDSIDLNIAVNNQIFQQPRELCKKVSTPLLNKNDSPSKKTICSTNNNVLNKARKREQRILHKTKQKLHEKVASEPHLSYKSINDTTSNTTVTFKNQGIQTLDTIYVEDLYSEGIIKYPAQKYTNSNEIIHKNETTEEIKISSRNKTNIPSDRGDTQVFEQKSQSKSDIKGSKLFAPKKEIDFIKLNKERISMVNKTVPQINNNNNLPPNYRIGAIPKYIKDRWEVQEKEQKTKIDELDHSCPNGHVPLPDCERKETLRMLKKNYQDYVNELNMMPIKVDTLRARRRKIEIEKQLSKLEEGIKVFSRPKVYVKINA